MGDYFGPVGLFRCIDWCLHQSEIDGITVSYDVKFIAVVLDAVLMFGASRSKLLKAPLRIIGLQDLIVTHQCTAVIDDDIIV